MAANIPSGLYTGGAVVFNSQPLASMYHQFVQRKMAQDDALDNYFRDYGKNINPAGMRQQDVDGLMQKQNEWNQFYQKNKAAIKNPRLDNGRALTEYQGRYQDQLAYIDKSKERVEVRKQMGQARLNPNLGYVFDDPEIIKQIEQDDLPLNDPNHKPIDIYQLNVQPKPFDVKARETYNKSVTAGLKPSESVKGISTDPKTLQDIVTYENSYSPEDLRTIGNRAGTFYQSDPSIKNYANKNLTNPAQFEQLNDVFQKVYGRPAETPKDLFIAETIANSTTTGTKQKATSGSLAKSLYMEGVRQGNRESLARLRHEYKQADADAKVKMQNGVYDTIIENALKNPIPTKESGVAKNEYQIEAAPDVVEIFDVNNEEGKKVHADAVRLSPDKKYVYSIVYKRNENGEIEKNKEGWNQIDHRYSKRILEQEFKARVIKGLFGAKEAKEQTSEEDEDNTTQPKAAPSAKPSLKKGMFD